MLVETKTKEKLKTMYDIKSKNTLKINSYLQNSKNFHTVFGIYLSKSDEKSKEKHLKFFF